MPLDKLVNKESLQSHRDKVNNAFDAVDLNTAGLTDASTRIGSIEQFNTDAFSGLDESFINSSIKGPRKTVVIFGSSNGAGLGASTYIGDPSEANGYYSPSTSWAGLLEARIKSLDSDFVFYNRSKSGSNSSVSVERFWTDVAPYRPSHVVLCTALGNESYDVRNFLKNTATLIKYCEQIGATPILRGSYPRNAGMDADKYNSCIALNLAIEKFGYPVIDHLSILDNGDGTFFDSATYSTDGTHLTDAGQVQFYNCIDPSFFLGTCNIDYRPSGAGKISDSTTSSIGIRLSAATEMILGNIDSAAASVSFNSGATPENSRILTLYFSPIIECYCDSLGEVLIRENNGTVLLSTGSIIQPNTDYTVLFSYSYPREIIEVFLNGQLIGSVSKSLSGMYAATLCGRNDLPTNSPNGYTFSSACLYRTSKDINLAGRLQNGHISYSSLLFAADFNSSTGVEYMPNLIKNNLTGQISPVWEL